jgi:hypothetical protein
MATKTFNKTKPVATPDPYGATKVSRLDVSIGGIERSNQTEKVKTSGVKTRGNGAATKGTMARGPMA